MAAESTHKVASHKARLAAIARHHGRKSLAFQVAKAQLDNVLAMSLIRDVADAYPVEFRVVARKLLADEGSV
jgi:hypothetical protein